MSRKIVHYAGRFGREFGGDSFTFGSVNNYTKTRLQRHGNIHCPLIYHLTLRCINAMALSATSPVLNGLTLARLQKDGRDSNEYGQERLCKCKSWDFFYIEPSCC